MLEVESYSIFYEGMDAKNKDLVNSSSGGSFSKLRVSEAKIVMEKLLCAKKAYDDTPVTLPQGSVVKTTTEEDGDQLRSQVDKLERAFRSVIETSHPQAPSVRTNIPTDQADYHQGAEEIWGSNRSWNPGRQGDAHRDEYPNCREKESNLAQPQGSWIGEYPPFPHQPEPYPNATQMPPCQVGYQDYQLCPDFQEYEPTQIVQQFSHLGHYPPLQIYHPKWPSEDRQAQNSQSYQNQTNPRQNQYHSHPQQGFEPPLNINRYANSIEKKIEGLIISQQSMRSWLKSNDELTLEMQNAHDEHKASMDDRPSKHPY